MFHHFGNQQWRTGGGVNFFVEFILYHGNLWEPGVVSFHTEPWTVQTVSFSSYHDEEWES